MEQAVRSTAQRAGIVDRINVIISVKLPELRDDGHHRTLARPTLNDSDSCGMGGGGGGRMVYEQRSSSPVGALRWIANCS
ncbi:hypothetical protein J6590_054463 [Homalodisca vitripennis]|nr:hypothetical protein J6590_054463 [Homalodisca vitripennis]